MTKDALARVLSDENLYAALSLSQSRSRWDVYLEDIRARLIELAEAQGEIKGTCDCRVYEACPICHPEALQQMRQKGQEFLPVAGR
jgi:hypothetical protein